MSQLQKTHRPECDGREHDPYSPCNTRGEGRVRITWSLDGYGGELACTHTVLREHCEAHWPTTVVSIGDTATYTVSVPLGDLARVMRLIDGLREPRWFGQSEIDVHVGGGVGTLKGLER